MTKTQSRPALLTAKKSDIEMVLVTPDQALAWLENTKEKFENRPVSEKNVQKISRDIAEGRWKFDGNPLRFDENGALVDGQHRLWAIVRADMSVLCLVVRNLQHNAIEVIDTGRSRSNGDILHMSGHVNCNGLAQACRIAIGYRKFEGNLYDWARSKNVVSSSEVVKEAQDNTALVKSIQTVISYKFTKRFVGAGTSAFCHYLFAERDKLAADEFFYLLEKGIDLLEGNAILALRNSLMLRDNLNLRAAVKGGFWRSVYLIALATKAWNAYREERFVKRLNFSDEKEKFPRAI